MPLLRVRLRAGQRRARLRPPDVYPPPRVRRHAQVRLLQDRGPLLPRRGGAGEEEGPHCLRRRSKARCGRSRSARPAKPPTSSRFECACRSTSRMCCCLVSEFALPCADDVPKTFVVYGLMLYPKVGCCVKVKDVMPAQVAPAAEKAGGAPPALPSAGAGAAATRRDGRARGRRPRRGRVSLAAHSKRPHDAARQSRTGAPPGLRFARRAWRRLSPAARRGGRLRGAGDGVEA